VPLLQRLGRPGAFLEAGRKRRGTTAVPSPAEPRAETTGAAEGWEERRVAARCGARGRGKHSKRAFTPLVSAKCPDGICKVAKTTAF